MRRAPPKKNGPDVPDPLPIARALTGLQGLTQLNQRMLDSERRMALVRPTLPGAMTRFVQAGPIDAEGWTLLASNAAVAAKLRQLQPRLEASLQEHGLLPNRIRIKIVQA